MTNESDDVVQLKEEIDAIAERIDKIIENVQQYYPLSEQQETQPESES